jgi:hypothetical protein
MKRILKRVPMRKKEAERTRVEKVVRDLAFFGVLAFTAVMAYATIDAEAKLAEAEADYAEGSYVVSMNI